MLLTLHVDTLSSLSEKIKRNLSRQGLYGSKEDPSERVAWAYTFCISVFRGEGEGRGGEKGRGLCWWQLAVSQ